MVLCGVGGMAAVGWLVNGDGPSLNELVDELRELDTRLGQLSESLAHLRRQLAARDRVLDRADEIIGRLRDLVVAHHAVGAMGEPLVGGRCPVCEREGMLDERDRLRVPDVPLDEYPF